MRRGGLASAHAGLVALWLGAAAAGADPLPQPAGQFDWRGFYFGANVGGALSLTDVADPFAASIYGDTLRTPLGALLPQVPVGEQYVAALRLGEPIGAAQQAGLAAAIRADQPDELPRSDVKACVTQLERVLAVVRRGPVDAGEGE